MAFAQTRCGRMNNLPRDAPDDDEKKSQENQADQHQEFERSFDFHQHVKRIKKTLIAKPRPEPFLDFIHRHFFPFGVIFDLVFLEIIDLEIVRVWMGEIDSTHG